MGNKSIPSGRNFKTGIIVSIVALAVIGSSIIYAKNNDINLKVSLGKGRAFGVWWGPNGEPHIETGQYGCCSPYCDDMFEIECTSEYGQEGTFYAGLRCAYDVPECRQGCCLPACDEVPKVQCEGDYGYGEGGWLPSQCRDVPECEIGCCTINDQKIQEKKAPCEDKKDGKWTQGVCKVGYTVDTSGSYTKTAGSLIQVIDYTYHMYTCSNTVYSMWQGGMESVITTSLQGESTTDKGSISNLPLSFEADNGTFNYNAGDRSDPEQIWVRISGRVNESNMTLNYSGGLARAVYDLSAEGPVKEGAAECESSK